MTMIDDSSQADQCFTQEENELIEKIRYNLQLWREEEKRQVVMRAQELVTSPVNNVLEVLSGGLGQANGI